MPRGKLFLGMPTTKLNELVDSLRCKNNKFKLHSKILNFEINMTNTNKINKFSLLLL